ncbi:ABC transporter permease [Burkholderia sp. WAC0059]|uniref:ABC transporter permease n=1 Tax=Burkholderia sp. WAC0059 TaxID=2066022 RepID=UPI0021559574|nr:ABC transporter permease [Burkholderia sp. WAC0059]
MPARRLATFAWRVLLTLVYAFILCPLVFVVWLSFFRDAIISFPPHGYTLSWYLNAWSNPAFADGFVLSVKLAAVSSAASVALGVLAALGLRRFPFRGSRAAGVLLLAPLVVPGIVSGVALYLFYLRLSDALGFDIAGTTAGLVGAHVCLTVPWTVRLVSASLEGLDATIEEAARNLGASAVRAFWRVTLPMLRPAIVASALFSFIISFENLDVSLLLVGPGNTTLPIAIMQYLEFNLDPTIAAVASMQILLLGIVMLVTDRFVKISKVV